MSRVIDPIPEAQQYLGGISRTQIYDLVDKGCIKRVNIGRRAFIVRESMDDFIASLATA